MKRTRMRRVSKKQSRENAEYRKAKAIFLEEYKWCPVMLHVKGSKCRTTEIHHTKARDGELLLDQRFWMAVSQKGHKWIQDNDRLAQQYGFRFLRGYGLHDQLEARICDRRRNLDFYRDKEYDQLMKDIKPEFEQ